MLHLKDIVLQMFNYWWNFYADKMQMTSNSNFFCHSSIGIVPRYYLILALETVSILSKM